MAAVLVAKIEASIWLGYARQTLQRPLLQLFTILCDGLTHCL